jgi:hypothetical protein
MHLRNKHVLILGCGRSGTSIFGEFFEHLPAYTYYSEPLFERLKSLNYSSPVAIKVPKESPNFPSSPGLSFPLDELFRAFPEPRQLYWQIRHPLDTICSLRVGIAENWGHHPKPPDWQDWLSRPLLERCAHHWNYINAIGFTQVAQWVKLTRFEDMIQNPVGFAYNICEDVGIDTNIHKHDIQQWAQRVQNTNNPHFVEAKISRPYSRPDHQVRIGRWKENLSEAEIERVLPIIRETAAKFDY